MFRGGRVDSRGTGITSGLYDGYADGGQIGGGTIYGNPTSDGRYDGLTSFSGSAITNLGTYNTGSGYIRITKL